MTNNTHSSDSDPKSPGFYTPMDIAPGEYAPTPHSSELDKLYEPYKVHHKDVECFNDHVAVTHLKQATQRLIASERQKAVDDMIQKIREWNWYDGDIDVNQSLDDLLDDLSRKDDEATNSNKGEAE